MLAPLHVSSHWSPGRGVLSPIELARRASEAGLDALPLTDFETLSGQVEHQHACRSLGLKPVTGVALGRGAGPHPRVVMLAEDETGYRSLCRIVTRRQSVGAGADPGDPIGDVLSEPEGLLALSQDPAAIEALIHGGFPAARTWALWSRPHGDDAHERALFAAARSTGVSIAAFPRLALARHEDLELLWLQRVIHTGDGSLVDVPRLEQRRARVSGLPFGAREELFSALPEAVAEARRILARCHPVPLAGGVQPVNDAGAEASARLAERARGALAHARADGRCVGQAYVQRLEHELAVIGRMGLAGWFLAVDEIAAHLARQQVDAVARGSSAGSLVVHLLGLAPVDPLAAGLVFERFLHERRAAPPDLDLDLASEERDRVLGWILARWVDRAALVASHTRYRTRSAWRDALRALGLSPELVSQYCRRLPEHGERVDAAWIRDLGRKLPESVRPLLSLVPRLTGMPRHLSTHPGAVVLADRAIGEGLPLAISPKGVPVTQYDGASLDELGIVRLDVLGSRGMQVLHRSLALANSARTPGHRVGIPASMAEIPDDDEPTFRRLDAGDTIGCFQVETPATREMLRRRRVSDLASLAAALAAVRPGPAGAENGPLYEEDVMRELASAAELSLAEADLYRSAIVRVGDDPEALAQLRDRYLQDAVVRGERSRSAPVEAAWVRAVTLASYAFSKAHASSHALLAYRSAWMRTHHPEAFAAALLDHYGGGYPKRSVAAAVVRWGLAVLPPCVNASQLLSHVEGSGRVRLGLARVRRVPERLRRRILTERERSGAYVDLRDFVRRVDASPGELEAIVLCGAADSLHPLTPAGYPVAHEVVLERVRLGAPLGAGLEPEPDPAVTDEYRALVRIRNELRFLGMHPTAHPLEVLRGEARGAGCVTIEEALASRRRASHGAPVRVAGVLAATHKLPGRGSNPFRFLTLEDETGILEATLAEDRSATASWTGGPYLAEGRFAEEPPDRLVLTRIWPFHHRHRVAKFHRGGASDVHRA